MKFRVFLLSVLVVIASSLWTVDAAVAGDSAVSATAGFAVASAIGDHASDTLSGFEDPADDIEDFVPGELCDVRTAPFPGPFPPRRFRPLADGEQRLPLKPPLRG